MTAYQPPSPVLVGLSGPMAGYSMPIPEEGLYIGRDTLPALRSDPAVSREHALIRWTRDGRLLIENRSSNGTWVNDGRVSGPTVIGDGDRIAIGQGMYELRIQRPSAVAGSHGGVATGGGATTIHGGISGSDGGVGAGFIGGDVNTGDYYDVKFDPYGLDDVSGFPRFLTVVGILAALAGFAFFAYPIVMGVIAGFDAGAASALCDQQFAPLTQENFDCHYNVNSGIGAGFQITPWLPIGAGLMFVGMVLTIVARIMKRNDEPERRRRRA